MTGVIILAAVAAVIVFWIIGVQNSLVKLDEFCKNALIQINVQQVSRFDALKALVKLTKDYDQYESGTLEKIVSARKITSSPSPTAAEVNENNSIISEVAGKLIAVAEAYPELKSNQQYLKTMDDIKNYEENVRLSRMTFNDTVTRYNKQVRMFPGSLVASMLGYGQKEYLAEDKSKTAYPEI